MRPTPVALEALLLDFARRDTALAEKALQALLDATRRYEDARQYLNVDGGLVVQGIAQDRASLRALGRNVMNLQNAFSNLSVHARMALGSHLNAPLGTVTRPLDDLSRAIEAASGDLDMEMDKPGDYHLKAWACEVAVVLREVLGIEPSTTRENAKGTHPRGGASYARLLREAYPLISTRGIDLPRLQDAGLTLLRDPDGPYK